MRGRVILFTAVLFAALPGCSRTAQTEQNEEGTLLALLGIAYMDSGNCARSYRLSSNYGQLYCSRAPRSLCNPYQGFFTISPSTIYGRVQVPKETQDRYRAEWAYLVSDFPDCAASSASASALSYPGYKVQTTSQAGDSLTRFSFTSLDDCAALGNSNAGKLATTSQYKFLTSAKGILAWQAKLLGQGSCLNALPLTQDERQLINDYVAGNVIFETSCNYGTSAAPNNCTTAEKSRAFAFDFTGSL